MYASVHTDRSGRVFVSDDHGAAAMDGTRPVRFSAGIPLPAGSRLVPLAREAVAYDRGGNERTLARGRLALGAVLPGTYVRHLLPAYRDDPASAPLDALPYAAVAADERGDLVVAAAPVSAGPTPSESEEGRPAVRAHPANALARQLARCARENGCRAARGGLGRGVLPVPLGAPVAERPRLPVALRSGYAAEAVEPAAFRPDAREIAEVAVDHLSQGGTAVAFGRACDGEPLAAVRVLQDAVAGIRARKPDADVRLETSAPDPAALRRVLDAGLTSITVRIASARPDTYEAVHGPIAHRWSDVRASVQLASERGVRVTIALLVLPGLTDRALEIEALVALLDAMPAGRLELRDLGCDPLRTLAALGRADALGMPELIARLGEVDHVRITASEDAPAAALR